MSLKSVLFAGLSVASLLSEQTSAGADVFDASTFDCNGYDYAGDFGLEFCYPHWLGGGRIYSCLDDNSIVESEFEEADCSGNATSVGTPSTLIDATDYQCSASTDCAFAAIIEYTKDTDCAEPGVDNWFGGDFVDLCYTSSFGGSSYQYVCDADGIEYRSYSDEDCSSDISYFIRYEPAYYANATDMDIKFYCSPIGQYSGCNTGSATTITSASPRHDIHFVTPILSMAIIVVTVVLAVMP